MTSRIWLFAAILLLTGPAVLSAQVKPGVMDLSASYGSSSINGANGKDLYPSFGFTAEYNVSHHVSVGAEYTYNILGTLTVVSTTTNVVPENLQTFGAVVRTTLWNRRISPYIVTAGGVSNNHAAEISGTAATRQSIEGGYAAGGVGANIFVSHGLGLRPEIRVEEIVSPMSSVSGVAVTGGDFTNVHGSIALFYQF